jgi:superfamily II DNA or RNA helicase
MLLIDIINKETPGTRNLIDYECIADLGCEKYSILEVKRNGEYYGFSIKVLENVKPLFTSSNIINAIKLLVNEDYDSIIRLFDIKEEFLEYGYNIIYYIIFKWLNLCKININYKYKLTFNVSTIDYRLFLLRNDPINVPIEIINIGHNIVPSEWIGKKFINAKELHSEINNLDWRRGKPPVTFCCTYSMTKININNIKLTKNIDKNKKYIVVELDKNQKAKLIDINLIKNPNYVEYNSEKNNILISFNPNDHFSEDNELEKYSVGLLSSTLQKCIRHGSCSTNLLKNTIKKLGKSKPYNLPEQQFLKVSGARQLFWKFFISSIEDFRYYYDERYMNLFDILILAMICNKEANYVINNKLLKKIKKLGTIISKCDAPFDYYEWKNYKNVSPKFEGNEYQKVIFIASEFMPKPTSDNIMINKYYNLLEKYIPTKLIQGLKKPICYKCINGFTCKYTAVDMYCYPNIILKMQACLEEKLTTQQISSIIWELNSKYNNRKQKEIIEDMVESKYVKLMMNIQKDYYGEFKFYIDYNDTKINYSPVTLNNNLSNYNKRILFLKLFGYKHRIPSSKQGEKVLEVIFSYYNKIQIKYVNSEEYLKGDEYDKMLIRVINYFEKSKIRIQKPQCLSGYKWIFKENELILSFENNKPVIYDYKDRYQIDWFDGSQIVEKLEIPNYDNPSKTDMELINNLLNSKNDIFESNIFVRKHQGKLIDLKQFVKNNTLFKNIYVKLLTSYDNIVYISQVTRTGERMDDSVDYKNEGKFWNILNLLKYCYNDAFKLYSDFKYKLNINSVVYSIMMNDLKFIISDNEKINVKSIIKINTKLWYHQEETVKFIISNIIDGKKGFGDASNIGSGKTLTALSVCCELYKSYTNNKVLVLLPTEKLYKTWLDEITKHFVNVNYVLQNANGTLSGIIYDNKLNIIITTMGRNRSHPLQFKWLFLIIDECLTVQNKEAIQTMASWKQSVNSEYGVLLLSATFFRTRFDKLLYMLKMLKCDLPETKEYLDTILCDSIKVNLPVNKRSWTEQLFKKSLDEYFYDEYNKIKKMEITNEAKFIKLQKYIYDNVNYINIFKEYIEIISKDSKAKLLVYAKSNSEAKLISQQIPNIGLYPNITKTHVVVSLAHGTYGLNDLIEFNQILCRPPEPDRLPQMKGRLDRPGQKEFDLVINYIIIDKTIENGDYLRLDLCNKFYSNYIMPLSEYYKISVN